MAKNIDLTSQEWRNLVFEGKNKEYGAYELRKKSPKRHVYAIVGVLVGLIILGFLIWGVASYQHMKEEEEKLAKAAEMQAAEMQAHAETKEEEPEEEEEIKYEEPEEVVPDAVAAQMVTEIAIEDVVDKEREVKTVEEVQSNEAQIGAVNQEGKIDVSQINDAVKEVTVAPVAPKVEPVVKKPEPEKIFEAVEQKAEFPGGQAALAKWLNNNLKYPELAQQNNIQGKVTVKFTVEKDGSISNPVIAKGVDKDLDREAIRVVKKMPKWKPGKNNGVAVRSYFYLPVVFRLANN